MKQQLSDTPPQFNKFELK